MQFKKSASTRFLRLNKLSAYSILILSSMFLFLVVYMIFSIYGLDIFSFFEKKIEIGPINVVDECSILAGQLLHTISIEDECNLKCRAECEVIDKEFVRAEFSFGNSSCNLCGCFCK